MRIQIVCRTNCGTNCHFELACPYENAVHIPLPIQIVRSTSCMSREADTNSTKIDTHTSCMCRLMLYITTIPAPPGLRQVQKSCTSNSSTVKQFVPGGPPGGGLAEAFQRCVKHR